MLLPKIRKPIVYGMLATALVGFLDATYLTVKHFLGSELHCSLIEGCEKVLTSPYANVGGIPLAVLGVVFYVTVFVCAVLYLDFKKDFLKQALKGLSIIGFLVSLALICLQVFVIQAICQYCMLSAASSITLFVLSFFL